MKSRSVFEDFEHSQFLATSAIFFPDLHTIIISTASTLSLSSLTLLNNRGRSIELSPVAKLFDFSVSDFFHWAFRLFPKNAAVSHLTNSLARNLRLFLWLLLPTVSGSAQSVHV